MTNTEKVQALLEAIETGDPGPFAIIHPDRYVQHNLQIPDGADGIAGVLQHKPPQGFKARVVRVFEDGPFVVAHTEYDFFGPKVGFDVFQFEDARIVEHWDNLADVQPRNRSGRSQFDGPTEVQDRGRTQANKDLVRRFIEDNWIAGKETGLDYVHPTYLQHNPLGADGWDSFLAALAGMRTQGIAMSFTRIHQVIGEGNFVLAMSEGVYGPHGGAPTSFYDLFRLEAGKIAEHWDVIELILPRGQWRHANGKF